MTDSEFRTELIDALNTIAVNTTHISRKIDVLNERLDSLKGIHSNAHEVANELNHIACSLEAIKRNGLPVDC